MEFQVDIEGTRHIGCGAEVKTANSRSTRSEPKLIVIAKDGIRDVDASPDYVMPPDAMPIWTSIKTQTGIEDKNPTQDMQGQVTSLPRSPEGQEKLLAIQEAQRSERRRRQKAKKAWREKDTRKDQEQFLVLYNDLHRTSEQMNTATVKEKFSKTPRMLKKAIKEMEGQQYDILTGQFGSIAVAEDDKSGRSTDKG
jgi:hypothetical protein